MGEQLHTNIAQVIDRRNKVRGLALRGLNRREIASALNANVHTIDKDIFVIKREFIKEQPKETETILREFLMRYEEIYREIWKIYHSEAARADVNIRSRLLGQLESLTAKKVDVLQSLGVVQRNLGQMDIREIKLSWDIKEERKEEVIA